MNSFTPFPLLIFFSAQLYAFAGGSVCVCTMCARACRYINVFFVMAYLPPSSVSLIGIETFFVNRLRFGIVKRSKPSSNVTSIFSTSTIVSNSKTWLNFNKDDSDPRAKRDPDTRTLRSFSTSTSKFLVVTPGTSMVMLTVFSSSWISNLGVKERTSGRADVDRLLRLLPYGPRPFPVLPVAEVDAEDDEEAADFVLVMREGFVSLTSSSSSLSPAVSPSSFSSSSPFPNTSSKYSGMVIRSSIMVASDSPKDLRRDVVE
mmetsp:Transcript_5282/g.15499  ORF Transcript_5282/g.15499 Transcript_5282/m.15499 type:complete len:260 (-) Transcript_5282:419-1198(-)